MIPELGHFALILALCLAVLQAAWPLARIPAVGVAKSAAVGQLFFLSVAFLCLVYAFVTHDFSVAYVAENSNTHLPLLYCISAVWGAHEGSLLLWVSMLSLWTVAVIVFSKNIPDECLTKILSVLALISIGFLLFLLTTSNPFTRILLNTPIDGQDLNPLLQDIGLAMHPPTLYMGYVGFAIAFAFAMAALIKGEFDARWVRWMRPWVLLSWCFLTVGITLGSWWAYRELGWGGWWFWDPVENASFLPWLVGTALIHSLAVAEKRDAFKGWTLLLAIFAFSLSLIGTFLVRSGILTSVHAFASDPDRGIFMLRFLLIVIGSSLLLYAWRAPLLKNTGRFQLFSRETLLLINNLLLVAAMATILLGTLYPLILDATGLGKISVGPPYFNQVFVPLAIVALLVMAIAPYCRWQSENFFRVLKRLRYTGVISLLLGIAAPLCMAGTWNSYVMLGTAVAVWVLLATAQDVFSRGLKVHQRIYAMWIAHVGVAVCVLGVTFTSAYSVQRDVRMAIGESVLVGPYAFQLQGVHDVQGANYKGVGGEFHVTRGSNSIATLQAEKHVFDEQQTVMTEAAIDAGLFRDLYVALGEPLDHGDWGVRIYYKPLVRWIWFGGFLILIGGGLALTDPRKREVSV
jgi:cytochrome c-type biogenesis protein CcmF